MASALGITQDREPDTPRGPLGAGLGGGAAQVPPFCLASLACTGAQVPPQSLVAPAHSLALGASPARAHTNFISSRPSPAAPLFVLWRGAARWASRFSATSGDNLGEALPSR